MILILYCINIFTKKLSGLLKALLAGVTLKLQPIPEISKSQRDPQNHHLSDIKDAGSNPT